MAESVGDLLVIDGRKPTCYRVIEQVVGPKYGSGRGFTLLKVYGGTDDEATGYDVFVSGPGTNGTLDACNCRGWLRHGHCKHHSAMKGKVDRGD